MNLTLDPRNGVPVYLQIVQQVQALVAAGRLTPGQQLPSVRKLAEQLVINPNTVVKSYRELEQVGVVVTRHGAGAFVADTAVPISRQVQYERFVQRLDAWLADSVYFELELDGIVQLVTQRFAFRPPRDAAAGPPARGAVAPSGRKT